jgi:hypothetical protein
VVIDSSCNGEEGLVVKVLFKKIRDSGSKKVPGTRRFPAKTWGHVVFRRTMIGSGHFC